MNKLFLSLTINFLATVAFGQSALDQFLKDVNSTKLGRNSKAGQYADIRGFKMYYETYGSGQPLLIIHGNSGSISDFVYQVPFFSKKFKVIIADSRAHGKSIDKSDSLSFEMMTDDLNALLEHLKLDSCFVLGWSDGGVEALLLAMRHPEKVKKLAVTGANLWPDSTSVDNWLLKRGRKKWDSLSLLPNTDKLKDIKKKYRLLMFEPNIKPQDLKKISCPSLIISGDHEVILSKHTNLIYESIPNAYLWIIPNSGHATPINFKDDFNRTVLDFFVKPYRKIERLDKFN